METGAVTGAKHAATWVLLEEFTVLCQQAGGFTCQHCQCLALLHSSHPCFQWKVELLSIKRLVPVNKDEQCFFNKIAEMVLHTFSNSKPWCPVLMFSHVRDYGMVLTSRQETCSVLPSLLCVALGGYWAEWSYFLFHWGALVYMGLIRIKDRIELETYLCRSDYIFAVSQ